MPSTEASEKTFKNIWSQIAKAQPDGRKFITFQNKQDLLYLYCTGFVNEAQYSVDDWIGSFQDSLQSNGAYQISEEQWLAKVKYHFSGPTGQPFDALALREGDWTVEEMEKLIKTEILPSLYMSEKQFREIFEIARKQIFIEGVYKVVPLFKEDLKALIDLYPSPARVRQLGVDEARKVSSLSSQKTTTPSSSNFEQGPSYSQTAANQLAALLGAKLK